MALLASSTLPSSPQYQIKVLRNKPCRLRWCLLSHAPHQISPTCSMKVTKAHFGEPSKVKLQLNIVKERLWHAIPDSAKEFPWRKAEDLLQISIEVFQAPEKRGLNLPLLVISCCFILVKVMSTYFSPFLLHVANGGLMQVLWLWGDSLKENSQCNEENISAGQNT